MCSISIHLLFYRTDAIIPLIATELSVGALLLVFAIFWTTLDMTERNHVTPLTMQAWWWAIRDGYLGNMVDFYFRNGGS
jgi:hypothetical protein